MTNNDQSIDCAKFNFLVYTDICFSTDILYLIKVLLYTHLILIHLLFSLFCINVFFSIVMQYKIYNEQI